MGRLFTETADAFKKSPRVAPGCSYTVQAAGSRM